MSARHDNPSSVLFDIVDRFERDRRSGSLLGLAYYLARFPGHEELVAREYFQLLDSDRAVPALISPPEPSPPSAGSAPPQHDSASDFLKGSGTSFGERLRRLAAPILRGARFQREEVIARGGMGVIHRVRDLELDRTLALKEMILGPAGEHALAAARFLEEAQVTAQLDHPGIVPIHDVGMDAEGRLFFAMKLVRGRDLRTILGLSREAREGWTQPRMLGVLLKVCEAMAYAHTKGVIHRDLKPGNVMVGHFGEVYVMDWGLARVLGRKDVHDIRLKLGDETQSLRTERRDEREETPDSPLVTMDGVVVGTPAYMSPEQARGEIHLLSPRSDVYSIGAMLYHLLTGQTPFVPSGARLSKHTVLARVIEGPPRPIQELAQGVPAELVAICDKAMARAPERRYADTLELSEDLRAYLEGRVVRAHATGAMVELRKWVGRNRAFASASAAALVVLVGGLITSSLYRVEAMDQRNLADTKAREAEHRATQVLQLSAFQRLAELETEAEELWPVNGALMRRYEDWTERANALVAELPKHQRTLQELRAQARPLTPEETAILRANSTAQTQLDTARREIAYHERVLAAWKAGQVPIDPSAEEASLDPGLIPEDPQLLCSLPRTFVGPEKQQRCHEAAGLFLARRAVERCGSASAALRGSLQLTLARALDDSLRFDEALEAVQRALETCGEEERLACEALAVEIERNATFPREKIEKAMASHLRRLQAQLEKCEQELASLPTYTFEETEDRWWYEQVTQLLHDIEGFSSREEGLCGPGVSPTRGLGIEKRMVAARLAQERSLDSSEAKQAWATAISSIADPSACPAYRGLLIEPQFGLLPIGLDPASELWEFAHLLSGEPPNRGPDGKLVLSEDSSLVLVLIPGGRFWMGSQGMDPHQPNFDPVSKDVEGPMTLVSLAPFLVSKYEVTQGQWLRLTGSNPSEDNPTTYVAANPASTMRGTLLHPVETLTCIEFEQTLLRFGLELPTEAQWEYTARAGTSTPWSTGAKAESLQGAANLYDPIAARADRERTSRPAEEWLSDGHISHAPVGSFAANAFGLHDTLGNVREWCRDWILTYKVPPRPGDGLREGQDPNPQRILRGGAHNSNSAAARAAAREGLLPHQKDYDTGARPVMQLAKRRSSR